MEKAIIVAEYQSIIGKMQQAGYEMAEIQEVLQLIANLDQKKAPENAVPHVFDDQISC